MPVTQVPMKPGSWSFRLKPNTPDEIIAKLRLRDWYSNKAGFAAVWITPTHLDLNMANYAGVVGTAIYGGIYRRRKGRGELIGVGFEALLGDESGKGLVLSYAPTAQSFSDFWDDVRQLHGGSELPAGTYYPQLGTITFADANKPMTLRDLAAIGCRQWSVEWRINPNMTFDVGPRSDLYGSPAALFHPNARTDEPGSLPILGGTCSTEESVEDWVSAIKMYGQTTAGPAIGEFTRTTLPDVAEPWFSPAAFGGSDSLYMFRAVPPEGEYADSTALDAQCALALFFEDTVQHSTTLTVDDYDPALLLAGKDVNVWVPDEDLKDDSAQMEWVAGEPIKPLTQRCVEARWGIPSGAGVYVQFQDSTLEPEAREMVDLTEWVDFDAESKTATLQLGASPPRWVTAIRNNYERWKDR